MSKRYENIVIIFGDDRPIKWYVTENDKFISSWEIEREKLNKINKKINNDKKPG